MKCQQDLEAELLDAEKRISALQARMTEMIEERRTVDRKQMVREFMIKFGQEMGCRPEVPDTELVRFRLRLIAEEFLELLEAVTTVGGAPDFLYLENVLTDFIGTVDIKVHLSHFVDATIDLDYVVEGTRIAFGVNSTPIWLAVHQSNMTKERDPLGGKVRKPSNWTPPDIEGQLARQR